MGPGGVPSRREARADRVVSPRPRRLSDLPLFPPGTGKAVVIVVLGVLLVAALLSAVQLKRDVDALKAARILPDRTAPAPAAPPTARLLAVPLPGPKGPPVLRIESIREGSVLVIPRSLLPGDGATVRLLLVDEPGQTLWENAPAKASRSAAEGDLPVSLPAGMPPKGTTFLRLDTGGSTSLLAILEGS